MAVRLLLNRLERWGYLQLPARQNRGGRRSLRPSNLAEGTGNRQPILGPLERLRPLSVHLAGPGDPARGRLAQYFLAHHYLGYLHPLGQLHYLVRDQQGRDLAGLLFGPAAWKCQPRDQFIGWTATQRQSHLRQVANNSRFMILPWVRVPGLASHILSLAMRRLPQDWQAQCGLPAVLVETFVEVERFAGTCYQASNWQVLGWTQGRTRAGRPGLRVARKRIYVRPLRADFRQRLCR